MNELLEFVKMSKYAGERFDLTQAGGGNSSVKLNNGNMLIKASGYLLSDVELEKGYATLNHRQVVEALNNPTFETISNKREREQYASQLINESLISTESRPSIETFLHSLLYRFTLHTHPVVVNMVTCQKDWEDRLIALFGDQALYVQYETPGIELAIAMNEKLKAYRTTHTEDPQIVFLQNHGVLISASTAEEVYTLNEKVLSILEKIENVDFSRYKYTNQISSLINQHNNTQYIAYLSEDTQVNQLAAHQQYLEVTPFCPDGYVFCGAKVLMLPELNYEFMKKYIDSYHDVPKVIVYQSMVFLIAVNVKKAKEMEEVFKFHLMTIHFAKKEINTLPTQEIQYLGNWEAEKYRQKL